MPNDSKLLDDLARVAGGAASLISTVRRQVKSDLRGRVDSFTDRMDLASREEIERLLALVASFRTEQDSLKKRVAEIESLLKIKKPAASPKTARSKTTRTAKAKRK